MKDARQIVGAALVMLFFIWMGMLIERKTPDTMAIVKDGVVTVKQIK